ncbi:MOSC domain-containing protein [Fictibacillus phosphorivorans]|uniref:MOSC domain-containing protein n=1 Tax=Fictibacillus phosphorivorans TaxID=1221500 RepID=UPI00203D5AE7|nr:MOSC domain-containing protein [Fictibacillus phosphorivorans]MCM3718410.1 MOSC domain-containing protein [Fictibacillus phosphorivorans]MCM3776034.1 MOSC domain-containing protein [Fictibacillus phosphorivorans]
MRGKVVSLNIKLPEQVTASGRSFFTGYHKVPQKDPVFLYKTHFEDDGVGDTVHHGGEDQAVCVYPFEYYEKWNSELQLDSPLVVPSFGENITSVSLLEDEVCIGDVFQMGEAIVQITQPRQPCNTLASIICRPDMIKRIVDTGRTGYYLRVLKEGMVTTGDEMVRTEKHPRGLTVTETNNIKYGFEKDPIKIQQLMDVKELAENFRRSLLKKT